MDTALCLDTEQLVTAVMLDTGLDMLVLDTLVLDMPVLDT